MRIQCHNGKMVSTFHVEMPVPARRYLLERSMRTYFTLVLATFSICAPLSAQAPRYDPATYEQTSADIPVRDGVTLHTEIFRPKDAAGPLPILLSRTPYGVGNSRDELTTSY